MTMKQIISLISAYLFILIGTGFSQNITSCNSWFYDTGGINGEYGNNENYTVQICSDGSSGTHTSLLLYPLDLGTGDFLCFYDGDDTNAPLLYCSYSYYNNRPFVVEATAQNATGCITAEFVSDESGTGEGWSAEVKCVPSCQPIRAEIVQTSPAVSPSDTGYLDICPGEYVELTARGLYPQSGTNYDQSDQESSFTWDFGDGAIAFGPTVRHQYNEEGGYYINLTIEDQEGCSSATILQQRVRVSPKPIFESRVFDETYCAGDTIQLESSLNGDPEADIRISSGAETFPTSKVRSDTLFLPDGTGASYSTDLNFLNFSPGQTLENAEDLKEICLFMEHSYAGDLEIEIICPNGQSALILEEFSASGTVNFGEPVATGPIDANSDDTSFGKPYLYCFKQNGTDYSSLEANSEQFEYTYTTLPDEDGTRHTYSDYYYPEGSYRPAQTFEQLEGCPLNGAWTLRVQDNLSQDNGWVFEWSIDFDEQLYPDLEEFDIPIQTQLWTVQPDVLGQSDGELTARPENGGYARYQLQVEDAFGCQQDTSAILRVYPEVHPDCYSCGEELDWLRDTALCENDELQLGEWTANRRDTVGFDIFPNESFGNASHPNGSPLVSSNIIESIYPDQLSNPEDQIAELCLDIKTNVVSDITAWLESPNGTRMLLFEQVGGFDQNFTQTCFSPSAASIISDGSAPFTGYFQPEGSWSDLENAAVNGEWKLVLSDAFGPLDQGVLNSWSIEFLYDYDWQASWSGEGLSCQDCPDPIYSHENSSDLQLQAENRLNCQLEESLTIADKPMFERAELQCTSNPGGLEFNWDIPGQSDRVEISYRDANNNFVDWQSVANDGVSFDNLQLGDSVTFYSRAFAGQPENYCGPGLDSLVCAFSILCDFDISVDTVIPDCGQANGTIDINLSGGSPPYSYDWADDPTIVDSMRTNLEAGTYTIIVSDSGCDTVITIDLFDSTHIFIDSLRVANNVSCAGGSDGQALVFARTFPLGRTGLDYRWNDPGMETDFDLRLVEAGTYTVSVTAQDNGCMLVDSVTITEPDSIVLSPPVITDVNCNGDSTGIIAVSASGGTPFSDGSLVYEWIFPNGDTVNMQNITDLLAGEYQLTVRDSNDCTVMDTFAISQPDSMLFVDIEQLDTSCAGQNTSRLLASANGGTPGYNFSWRGGPATPNWDFVEAGIQIVDVTDANGCLVTDSIVVEEYDSINAQLTLSLPSCEDVSDGSIAVTQVSGGSGGGVFENYNYAWNFMGGDSVLLDGVPGGQTYEVTITDANGCQGVFSRDMPLGDTLFVELLTQDVLCAGDSTGRVEVSNVINANLPIVSYNWNTGDTTALIDSLGPGIYTVFVEDSAGCTDSASYEIEALDSVQIALDLDLPACSDTFGTVTVIPSGGMQPYMIQWQGSTDTSFTREQLLRGEYPYTVTDANGCTRELSVFITDAGDIDSLNLLVDSIICHNTNSGAIRINVRGGNGPYMYSYDGGQSFSSFSFNPELGPGVYPIIVRDSDGCTFRDTVSLRNPDPLTVGGLSADTTMIFGDTLRLTPVVMGNQGSFDIFWDDLDSANMFINQTGRLIGDTTALLYPIQNNFYSFTVIDSLGCMDEFRFLLRVDDKDPEVYVPTAFTPGNPNNNLLGPLGREGVFVEEFRIYDRWGELVYSEEDFMIDNNLSGWDGIFEGEECQPGVYVWYAQFIFTDGETYVSKGHTTLLR